MTRPPTAPTTYPALADILNPKTLRRHLSAGLVTAGTHDVLPLWVYDYTSLCERRRTWDQVTTTCRGLVRDNQGQVIARPFQKFLGWGQKSTSALRATRWTDDWYAVEKIDGTMVTASNYHGHLLLATRRTFDAWQLARVHALWPHLLLPAPGSTWLLEYVGPQNQVVVFYHDEAIYAIGAIDNATGADLPAQLADLHRSGFRAPKLYEASLETYAQLGTRPSWLVTTGCPRVARQGWRVTTRVAQMRWGNPRWPGPGDVLPGP